MNDRERMAELKQLAHDVRNALNGVAINLEVARTRGGRGVDIADVAPFLETAAQQLEVAARLHKRYTDAVSNSSIDAGARHSDRSVVPSADDTPSHP
ncbi:MAG: hypothetical protein ABI229_03895 [Gemmatimonadaceae bacterium]